jgi:hypothetical protein
VVPGGFLVTLNVPSFYLVVAPLSLLPWPWANFVWALGGVTAVAVIAVLLLRMASLSPGQPQGALLLAMVACFVPFHTALHVGNAIAICTALLVASLYLAERERNRTAGALLVVAACIKPQLALPLLLLFLFRRRWAVVSAMLLPALLVVLCLALSLSDDLPEVMAGYRQNAEYWFRPAGQNDFGLENRSRLQLINAQVILAHWVPSRSAANLIAYALGLAAVLAWCAAVLRRHRSSPLLAAGSGLAVGLFPIYHRAYDAAVLTVALAWSLKAIRESQREENQGGRRAAWAVFLLSLGFLLPGGPFMIRLGNVLPAALTGCWLWKMVVLPYQAWTVLLMAGLLLSALLAREEESVRARESSGS